MSDALGVTIGEAAVLYGLAPSTLRWWESRGVLPEPPRINGRRVYTETELRRIGLAYLCCVRGLMPLEQAAVVTTGNRNSQWQSAVRRQAALIEEKIEELQSAHRYLRHLSECPDDDIVGECPWLDGELMNHTPRGRIPIPGSTAAAQSIPRPVPPPGCRDETDAACDETSAPSSRCAVCAAPFPQPATGRRRRYCTRACQQRHYRRNAR